MQATSPTAEQPQPRTPLWLTLIFAGALLSALLCGHFTHNYLLEKAESEAAASIEESANHFNQIYHDSRILGTVQALGTWNPTLRAACTGKPESVTAELTTILEATKAANNADIAYILNKKGLALASTKLPNGGYLTGNRYAFREYFQDALRGDVLCYPALGTTTNQRGLYYAAPIRATSNPQGPICGVFVIKMGLQRLDEALLKRKNPTLLVSPTTLVFASSRPAWRFRRVGTIAPETLKKLQVNRQFYKKIEDAAPLGTDFSKTTCELDGATYIISSAPVSLHDDMGIWRLYELMPASRGSTFMITALTSASAFLLIFALGVLVLFIQKRHINNLNRLELAEARLQQQEQQLLQNGRLMELELTVSAFTHEIGTPVGNTLMVVDTLRAQLKEIEEKVHQNTMHKSELLSMIEANRECIDIAVENIRQSTHLIQSFKHVAIDKTSDRTREINLKEYLRDIVMSMRPRLKKTKHAVSVSGDDKIEVMTHPGVLAQIIVNWIVNSLRHGFEHMEQGEIQIAFEKHADDVITLTYSDNGCGMTPEVQQHIFERFYTTKPNDGGSGMGLYLIKSLAEGTLHCQLSCKSAPETGTTFTLTGLKAMRPVKKVEVEENYRLPGAQIKV